MTKTKKQTKFVFVTGGVLSGLGKGITAASIGNILKARGFSVNAQKLDPYLNVDAGTLNPAEHGECFVTMDGAETDLDLGHYERFLDVEMTQNSSQMSGRILLDLISGERAGQHLGKTVQVVPHFTNAIKEVVYAAAEGFDIHIVEIGGTVGDYESPAFFEAIREIGAEIGRENAVYAHVVYLPYLGTSKEVKTKPAQNATRDLRALGITPDVLAARSEVDANGSVTSKLAAFTGVDERGIVLLPNARTVYEVPLTLEERGLGQYLSDKLNLKKPTVDLTDWKKLVKSATTKYEKTVKVGVVAKYMDNEDTYLSVFEALKAAAWKQKVNLEILWVNAEKLEAENGYSSLKKLDGIVVPGGFGLRALEGKIKAARYCLKTKTPYLGLCLGLQMAVVAAARENGLKTASSLELDPDTSDPLIYIMEGQSEVWGTGGTMRLGDYECVLADGSLARKLYGKKTIIERHRHRYEVNNKYREFLEKSGVKFAGLSPDGNLVELIEMADHPFFMASQYHPEFKSRPNRPHPMFDGFISTLKNKLG
jgi:CTP synthase